MKKQNQTYDEKTEQIRNDIIEMDDRTNILDDVYRDVAREMMEMEQKVFELHHGNTNNLHNSAIPTVEIVQVDDDTYLAEANTPQGVWFTVLDENSVERYINIEIDCAWERYQKHDDIEYNLSITTDKIGYFDHTNCVM